MYAAWINSKTGEVIFRQSSNGGGAWSAPLVIGTSTATQSGAGYGVSGFANISAVRDLITVAWIADDTGTLKVRGINLNGNAAAATTIGNWSATATLADKISVAQNGFPIASASPQNTGVVTVAYNTDAAQKFVTYNGTRGVGAQDGLHERHATYPGGYSIAVEPAPAGGYVAMWAGCRDTGITNPCNYGSAKAKFDLLAATSPTGTTFGAPTVVAGFDHQGHAQRRAVVGRHPRYVGSEGLRPVQRLQVELRLLRRVGEHRQRHALIAAVFVRRRGRGACPALFLCSGGA